MTSVLCYCEMRSHLEGTISDLTADLMKLVQLLRFQVGLDHEQFLRTRARCFETRCTLTEARGNLQEHRGCHGC